MMRSSLISLAMLALATGCGGRAGDAGVTPSFREDVSRLEQRTTPAGALSTRTLEPAIRGSAAEAAWEVKTDLPWPEYSRWVQQQLAPEFNFNASVARELRASKGSSTDLYSLTIISGSLDSATVSIEFRATPQ